MNYVKIAGISGALCVVLGAFGAHALKTLLPDDQLAVFETGVRYQFYHTLAILFCGLINRNSENKKLKYAVWFFITGIIFFSGSLYLLSTRSILGTENWTWLGPITPLGGLFFIAGWISLALADKNKIVQ